MYIYTLFIVYCLCVCWQCLRRRDVHLDTIYCMLFVCLLAVSEKKRCTFIHYLLYVLFVFVGSV